MSWMAHLEHAEDAVQGVLGTGKVADYIPALACAPPDAFAMAVAPLDADVVSIGAADVPFSIQSISKVFTLTLALEQIGAKLFSRVGREPSGSRFNSIVQLENEEGIPRNPFINAGAIATTDVIVSNCGAEGAPAHILDCVKRAAGIDGPYIDKEVAASEQTFGDRNRALAYFMKTYQVLSNPVDLVLDAYFHQCAIAMTTRDLARAGRYLAAGGTDPVTGERMTTPGRAKRINALMLTCGHYDMSGDFAFRVGLPGKSGVGGGILAIVPGVASIAVWSPALNEAGNSLAGTLALEQFATSTGLSIF